MPAATSVLAGAAVVSAGVGLWGAYQGSQRTGSGDAPPPSNYYEYDSDGNLVREQVWDSAKNGYVAKTYKTEQEKKDEAAKTQLRNQFLSNLSKTPEDRAKAYDEYASTFSKQMHKDVDEQYTKTEQATAENLTGRGLLGSKAYADTMSELNKQKLETDTDIAEKASMAKETLASNDRSFWLQGLTALDSGIRADQAQEIVGANTAANIANQGTAAGLGAYYAKNNANYQNWLAKQNFSNQMTNTATGLAFLYGYMGKGGSNLNPKVSTKSGNFDFGIG